MRILNKMYLPPAFVKQDTQRTYDVTPWRVRVMFVPPRLS